MITSRKNLQKIISNLGNLKQIKLSSNTKTLKPQKKIFLEEFSQQGQKEIFRYFENCIFKQITQKKR